MMNFAAGTADDLFLFPIFAHFLSIQPSAREHFGLKGPQQRGHGQVVSLRHL